MFSVDFLMQMILPIIGNFLTKPASAAKYAKWLIRIRNYLNLLFPPEVYPANWEGTNINPAKPERYAVPVEAVKSAASNFGFKIPFFN
jgi:hypothetical protein